MRIITNRELMDRLAAQAADGTIDAQTDLQGQIVIYTGWFEWDDQTVRDEPQPDYDKSTYS